MMLTCTPAVSTPEAQRQATRPRAVHNNLHFECFCFLRILINVTSWNILDKTAAQQQDVRCEIWILMKLSCTMLLGNQHYQWDLNAKFGAESSFDLIYLKHVALDMSFKRINT